MDYYCDVCGKTIKIKSKNKQFQSLSRIEVEKCLRIKHTIENPDYFDIDKNI